MNLKLEILKKEEIDLFKIEEERAFDVHSKYFEEGLTEQENEKKQYDPSELFDHPKVTILSIKNENEFIGGVMLEEKEEDIYDIGIFFIKVEYQGEGIGQQALNMVERYFSNAKKFTLITPSQVLLNTVFYVNKCGYKISRVINFDRDKNTADFIFEKIISKK
ncbi:MAG: GNAT family N-acetyltransferase [Gemella sp.]|nr:GNAT family N-acetyltransferase [Gemella sp.]